jgi:hypothetical protein
VACTRNRCTAAINAVAGTLWNYRINDFQSQGQGLLQKKYWFCAQGVGTPGLTQSVNTVNITRIVEYVRVGTK